MSRIIAKAKIASRMAPNAGIYSAACQSLNHAIPNRNSSGGMPPPTLCAQFHTETIRRALSATTSAPWSGRTAASPSPEPAAEEQQHEHYHDAGRRPARSPSPASPARRDQASRQENARIRAVRDRSHDEFRKSIGDGDTGKGEAEVATREPLLDKIRHRGQSSYEPNSRRHNQKMPIKICQRNRRYSGSISAAGKRALCAAGLKILNISASVALAVFY